jgi:branched-chain amino acid transport system ATP-binding protein
MSQPLLRVDNLTVRFGGLVAVNDVSFAVDEGELLGIIGPNGAGKTTTFNAIAGAVRPTSGTIRIGSGTAERLVSGQPPERVARLGIARTFQSVRLFAALSVAENVTVAAGTVCPSMTSARRRADEVIELLGLGALRGKEIGELPLADQKKVEIARALALEPRLLLLDEMMSGLTQDETRELITLVTRLNADGLTIVVIEHVLRVIMQLSHRVVVLDHGTLIAQGPPKQVMTDPLVVEAYLGAAAAKTVRESV